MIIGGKIQFHTRAQDMPTEVEEYLTKRTRILPRSIREILNTGSRYSLTLDAPNLSLEHKAQMPAWHHIGKTPGTRRREFLDTAKYLRANHKVRTIGDLVVQESFHENQVP